MDDTTTSAKRVLAPDDVRRATTRMAHEILERNGGVDGLVLLGLQKGGVWLARQLGQDKPRTMAALTSLMTRFCVGEDSWLAHSTHDGEAGTSETRDANGKPKRNKNKRRHRNGGSDTEDAVVNAGFTGP